MKTALRPWKKKDITALTAIANNINVWNNLRDRLPHPYTKKDAEWWISYASTQQPMTNFAIEADDILAGSIGYTIHNDVYKKNAEIGYFLGEPFWGKGIATEAVRLLIDELNLNKELVRVYATVFDFNTASMKVLEKNGFHLEAIHKKAVFKNGQLLDEHLWVRFINDPH